MLIQYSNNKYQIDILAFWSQYFSSKFGKEQNQEGQTIAYVSNILSPFVDGKVGTSKKNTDVFWHEGYDYAVFKNLPLLCLKLLAVNFWH